MQNYKYYKLIFYIIYAKFRKNRGNDKIRMTKLLWVIKTIPVRKNKTKNIFKSVESTLQSTHSYCNVLYKGAIAAHFIR